MASGTSWRRPCFSWRATASREGTAQKKGNNGCEEKRLLYRAGGGPLNLRKAIGGTAALHVQAIGRSMGLN